MKKIYITFFLCSVLLTFLSLDFMCVKKRVEFLSKYIEKKCPEFIYKPSIYSESEYDCDFWDKNVSGWGYCYYVKNHNNESCSISVYGFFSSSLYKSDTGSIVMNPAEHDFKILW